jgi:exopolysaccharide biosynthesis polyprenyl glycosylphosphotransferase
MLERLWRRATRSVLLWDIGLTLAALWLAVHVRGSLPFGAALERGQLSPPPLIYPAVVLIWGAVFMLFYPQRSLFEHSLTEALGRLMVAIATATLVLAGALYLSYRDVSRLLFVYFAVFDLTLLLALHLLVWAGLRTRGSASPGRVLIVGAGRLGRYVSAEIAGRSHGALLVAGYLDDDRDKRAAGVDGLPVFGRTVDIVPVVQDQRIDEVIFALPPEDHRLMERLALRLEQLPVRVHMAPDVLELAFTRTTVESIGGLPLISLREPLLSPPARRSKRLFDIVVSATLLLLLSPLLLLIALLIKLDAPGPALYAAERIGENGRRFRMLKFRTMKVGADAQWQQVATRTADGKLQHKSENDPRITRLGRRLRRTSLDELPQLINVLRGEMSLVGPRPEVPYVVQEYEPWQWRRFAVQPGITGWWQVNGRSDKPMHLNTQDDLYYIQHYSIWLDLKILWRTVGVVFGGKGAY